MKKRMFLSTILMTLVLLLAVTTATFAWYSASQSDANFDDTATGSLTAKTDTITLGALTFTVDFAAVSEGEKPTYLADPAGFQGTDLTDAAGVSKYWTGQESVVYTATKQVGVAKAVVTASVAGDPAALAAALTNLYGGGQTTVTLTIDASGQITVSKDAVGLFNADPEKQLTIGNDITFTLNLAADGSVSSWESTFYYATRTTGDAAEGSHASDAIAAKLSK